MVRGWRSLLAVVVLALVGTEALGASERISIGFLINNKEREAGLYQGVVERLTAGGFGEDRARHEVHVAMQDRAKMAQVAEQFATSRPHLILVFGSSTTEAVVKRNKEIPIVFVGTYDPEGLGIGIEEKASGTNVTGVSSRLPMEALAKTLRRTVPFKRLGIVYSQRSPRSGPARRAQEMKALHETYGFTAVDGEVKREDETLPMVKRLVEKEGIDALYVAGGTEVSPREEAILSYAIEKKIPTITHDIEDITKGYLLAVGVEEARLGRRAGEMAVQILKGEKPGNIPIEAPRRFMIHVNLKTASAINLKIPLDLLQSASKVVR